RLAVLFHGSAQHMIRAEDSAHALASSGAQKSSEAVYLSLVDMEIERLDSCIAVKILHFKDRKLSLFLLVGLIFSMNIGKIIQLLAQHLGYQLYAGQI